MQQLVIVLNHLGQCHAFRTGQHSTRMEMARDATQHQRHNRLSAQPAAISMRAIQTHSHMRARRGASHDGVKQPNSAAYRLGSHHYFLTHVPFHLSLSLTSRFLVCVLCLCVCVLCVCRVPCVCCAGAKLEHLCMINHDPDQVIRSLFYNNTEKEALITIGVNQEDGETRQGHARCITR